MIYKFPNVESSCPVVDARQEPVRIRVCLGLVVQISLGYKFEPALQPGVEERSASLEGSISTYLPIRGETSDLQGFSKAWLTQPLTNIY
jgi:hypothetical protein